MKAHKKSYQTASWVTASSNGKTKHTNVTSTDCLSNEQAGRQLAENRRQGITPDECVSFFLFPTKMSRN